jgi:hypothetical protein
MLCTLDEHEWWRQYRDSKLTVFCILSIKNISQNTFLFSHKKRYDILMLSLTIKFYNFQL